jgi:hypothetical protein
MSTETSDSLKQLNELTELSVYMQIRHALMIHPIEIVIETIDKQIEKLEKARSEDA